MFEPLAGRFTCAHVRPEETARVTGILCKIVTHCDHVWWTSVALRAPLYIERRSFIPIQSAPPFQRACLMIQLDRSSLTVCCIALVCVVTSLSCNKDGTSDIIHTIDDTSPSFGDFFPDWSPDGQWIAYIHDDPLDSLHPSGLYVVDTAGNHSRLLRRGYVTTPVWSQDGLWIAFQSGTIWAIRFADDSLKQITSFTSYYPSWSPDGTHLAFDSSYGDSVGAHTIWLVDFDGAHYRNISQHGVGEWRNPSWSPAGDLILHLRYITGAHGEELFLMDTSGNNARRLTNNNLVDRHPKFSRDGRMIAWTQYPDGVGFSGCWIMNTDGSSQHRVVYGQEPSWSPNGGRLVFSSLTSRSGKSVIWTVNIDGSDIRQITH
jgi:Tol biopolymer transport system component